MAAFQVFDKRAIPLVKRPQITIQKKGPLSLNASAFHALGEPEAVELLYDPDERIIGLRAVDSNEPHAYPVRRVGPKAGTFLVAGHAFLKYYGIKCEVSMRYTAEMFDGVLGIDLKKKGVEASGNRDARKRYVDEAPNGESEGAVVEGDLRG